MDLLFDIGGTHIKSCFYNKNTIIKMNKKIKTPVLYNELINSLVNIINKKTINHIYISITGLVMENGLYFYGSKQKKDWIGKNIIYDIKKHTKVSSNIFNDGLCAAKFLSVKRNVSNGICIVLGTGIGVAKIQENNIVKSNLGFPLEFSVIETKEGTLDDTLSLTTLSMKCKSYDVEYKFEETQHFMKNTLIKKEIDEYFSNLSKWIYFIGMALGEYNFYIGGSVSYFGDFGLKKINSEIKKSSFIPNVFKKMFNIKFIDNNEKANLEGAFFLTNQ